MTPADDKSSAVLEPPQFCLRTLMLAVSGCSVVFALMAAGGALWSMVLALFLALIIAHVAGNALGTRLRARAPVRVSTLAESAHSQSEARSASIPAIRLRERTEMSRAVLFAAIIGALLGAAGGGTALACRDGEYIGATGLVLGTISSGVLGGFGGYLASSFCTVFRRALAEALADPTRN